MQLNGILSEKRLALLLDSGEAPCVVETWILQIPSSPLSVHCMSPSVGNLVDTNCGYGTVPNATMWRWRLCSERGPT